MYSGKNKVERFSIPVLFGLLLLIGCVRSSQSRVEEKQEESMDQDQDQEVRDSRYDMPPHHFIRRGMNVERVENLVGKPERKQEKSGRPDVWHYSFGVVMVEQGSVRYKYPPSELAEKDRGDRLENSQ